MRPKWLKSKFLRNIATLVSGTALAQVAGLLFVPWITRLYGPEAFGGFGYFSSLLGFLTPFSALCYPLALVLPRRFIEARLLFEISLKILVAICFLSVALFFIIEHVWHDLLPFSSSYFFVPLGVFLSVGVMAYTQWAIRCGCYRLIARVTILAAVIGGTTKVVLGYLYPSTTSLVVATVAILGLNIYMFSRSLGQVVNLSDILTIRTRHWMVAKKYLRFPVYRMPHSVIDTLRQTAPVFLLTSFFGAKYAGYFVLTRLALSAPVMLIGKSVYDASYPRIAQRYNEGLANFGFILKVTVSLAAISMVPLVIVFLAGGSIFSIFFGPEWERAGVYAGWMAIWFSFNFSNKAIAAAVSVYSMDGFLFRNGVLNMFLSFLGFFIGAVFYSSDVASVALFSLFGVFCQCLLIARVLQVVRNVDSKTLTNAGM